MKLGLIGLGKMGAAIAERALKAGHELVAYDRNADAVAVVQKLGAQTVNSAQEVAQHARIVWLMVPAGEIVDAVLNDLKPSLQEGDIVIDGGNSHFPDSVRRAQELAQQKINFLDCGTSGGLLGREIGFCLMVGGDKVAYEKVTPILKSVAAPNGYEHVGPAGAGHYVKMAHNGIEYALLQAYAEGFHLLKNGEYKNLDMEQIAGLWRNGAVIRSWLLDLAHNVFKKDQELKNISGEIAESGTGRWTVDEAHKQKIPVDLIERALAIRAESRKMGGSYATKVVALLRNQFGGHSVNSAHPEPVEGKE